MAFKNIQKNKSNIKSPQELFGDLRNRKVAGLLDHQSNMIDAYINNHIDTKDIALELPTGSGKTLIGLLIAEFRRLKFGEKIVYLCPTNQLVNQVVEQSKDKYGIKTIAFTGKFKDYTQINKSLYNSCKSIAVTTYSSFFNNSTFFNDPDVIIFDDAHSAENYISSFWSVNINSDNNNVLFRKIVELFKESIGELSYNKMINSTSNNADLGWSDKISIKDMIEKMNDLVEIINSGLDDDSLYSWVNIKDYIHACNIYIDCKNILIRPYIPPTNTFKPFTNAKQRIYMSATLGESGELERTIGVSNIKTIPVPSGWDKQGIGRRFFMFPTAKYTDEETLELMNSLIKKVDRSLILVPNTRIGTNIKKRLEDFHEVNFFNNSDISDSKENFTHREGIAILANRFDGIDFENDECRLEFIIGFPKTVNLQERFLITRLATSILFNERIKTRLTQAIGRCTRGMTDYSAVCIIGDELLKELTSIKKLKLLHPELQAEISFGFDQSIESDSINDFIENFDTFLEHSDEWDDVESVIINERSEKIQSKNQDYEKLKKAASHEVKYQYALWKKDYKKAIDECDKILSLINGNSLAGYRGLWNYFAACNCIMADHDGIFDFNTIKNRYINAAITCNSNITWFKNLKINENSSSTHIDTQLISCLVEVLENTLAHKITNRNKFESLTNKILMLLDGEGTNVEEGLKLLGELIGFESYNNKSNGAPDSYWILGNELCIISESKKLTSSNKPLDLEMIREAKTHEEWLKHNIPRVNNIKTMVTVFVTNSNFIHKDAVSVSSDLFYLNLETVKKFANKIFVIIRELLNVFVEEGDLTWRDLAIEKFIEEKLTPKDILENIISSPLNKLSIKR
ncbi:DEAD/DEAH box helicase family protein [Clostridium sp. Ade.TY]|uniref:DEAD/DEAH box helicase family protein n=1 Tax=Clostridium sp. Ade.TY TaxID=1391647 RepID=UPI0003F75D07|nr:DEAD/DEAH box helicase family protein [Clostridium sp. Ade.TY]